MNRALVTPLIKLSLCCAALIGLIVLSLSPSDSPFQGLAIVTTIVVAGPVTLLVAIDFGRVLKRQPVSPTAKRVWAIPQRLLGAIACVAGAAGVVMSYFVTDQAILLRLLFCLISFGIIASGIGWIRDARQKPSVTEKDRGT